MDRKSATYESPVLASTRRWFSGALPLPAGENLGRYDGRMARAM
jgi:hypothetical protein